MVFDRRILEQLMEESYFASDINLLVRGMHQWLNRDPLGEWKENN